jgi:hypothetical protein
MKSFVVKALDHSKPERAGNRGDVFPFFVSLQDVRRRGVELLVDPAVLLDSPQAQLYTYLIWYVNPQRTR